MESLKHEITEVYKKKLEDELKELNDTLIPANVRSLQEARSQGDLSENADYDAARDEQARLAARVNEIKDILKNSKIIVLDKADKIQIGSYATLEYEGPTGKIEKKFQVVSSVEADIFNDKLSNKSPFGTAITGHKKGDTVKVYSPKGEIQVKILDVTVM